MPSTAINVKALNAILAQTIVPLFWGTIALIAAAPIAAAAGGWVAEKITGGDSKKKKRVAVKTTNGYEESSRYD